MNFGRKVPEQEAPAAPEEPPGETLIALRNTYGQPYRWTELDVQGVALRLRNSEAIPLVDGYWLSPWNVDTFVSKAKWLEMNG